MDKSTEKMLTYGAIGVGVLLVLPMLTKGKTTPPLYSTKPGTPGTPVAPGSPVVSNPALPPAIQQLPANVGDNYEKIIYPAMLAANPNIGNPNYTLTDGEAQTYWNNYRDLREGAVNWFNGNHILAARDHWHTNGVPEKRTFMPLNPPTIAPYIGPPVSPKSGGSSFWSGVLGVATSVLDVVLGDGQDIRLSDREVELIANSGAVIKQILPFYYNADLELAGRIDAKLDELLKEYL